MTKKTKKIILITACVLVLAIAAAIIISSFVGFQPKGVNLIKNGGFDDVQDGLPAEWYAESYTSGADFSVVSGGYDGNSAKIVSNNYNDARFVQKVSVNPNAIYRLSAWVKTEDVQVKSGVDENKGCANVSVMEMFYISQTLSGDSEWTRIDFYGQTGAGQKSILVAMRLGFYSGDTMGTAYFDNVELVQVDSVPAGIVPVSWVSTMGGGDTRPAGDVQAIEGKSMGLGLLFIFVVILVFTFGYRANNNLFRDKWWIFMIIFVGLLVRLYKASTVRGFYTDINCFSSWAGTMAQDPLNFYNNPNCDYPPLYMMLLGIVGTLSRWLNLPLGTLDSPLGLVLLKIIPIACDLLLGWFIYRVASKKLGVRAGTCLAAVYIFNPVTIINSASWGQVDSVLILFMVLAIYCFIKRKYALGVFSYLAGLLIKPQALIFAPIMLFGAIKGMIECGQDLRKPEKKDIARKRVLAFTGSMLGSVAIFFGLSWLFMPDGANILWLFEHYFNTMGQYPWGTLSAFDFFGLIGGQWVAVSEGEFLGMSYEVLNVIMTALAIAIPAFLYWIKRVRAKNGKIIYKIEPKNRTMFLAAAVIAAGVATLPAMVHERYMFPALALILMAFVVYKDRRLIYAYAGLSGIHYINVGLVLYAYGGKAYTGNEAQSYMTADNPFMIIGSLLICLLFIYLVYVAFSIRNGHIKEFEPIAAGAGDEAFSPITLRDESLKNELFEKELILHAAGSNAAGEEDAVMDESALADAVQNQKSLIGPSCGEEEIENKQGQSSQEMSGPENAEEAAGDAGNTAEKNSLEGTEGTLAMDGMENAQNIGEGTLKDNGGIHPGPEESALSETQEGVSETDAAVQEEPGAVQADEKTAQADNCGEESGEQEKSASDAPAAPDGTPLVRTAENLSELKVICTLESKRRHDFNKAHKKRLLDLKDILIMAVVTIIYSVVAFINLGSTEYTPSSYWETQTPNEEAVIDFGGIYDIERIYLNLNVQEVATDYSMRLYYSEDGTNWQTLDTLTFNSFKLFVWNQTGELNGDNTVNVRARYFRIVSDSLNKGMRVNEIVFYQDAQEDILVPIQSVDGASGEHGAACLTDEQDTAAVRTYMSCMYFDEIYHARTAYENINSWNVYEWTHPPLGKVIMSLGIRAFGMNPFGWRFCGTVAGILMLPAMYIFGKLLFKKRVWASALMLLMTLDGMHYVQTRIATIDSYSVLFIILMFLCMYKYYTMSFYEDKLWKTFIPLGLSGIFFGLGAATKWICLYAGVGLAVIFFISLGRRIMEYMRALDAVKHPEKYSQAELKYLRHISDSCLRNVILTLLFCVLFFVIIPGIIYCLSYIPYFDTPENLGKKWYDIIWQNQEAMFNYHSGLSDSHSFRSPWYEWPVMARPMWFYDGVDTAPAGMMECISCCGNPLIWWAGLVCTVISIAILVKKALRRYKVTSPQMLLRRNREVQMLLFITLGLAANYLAWVFVPRSTFIYHYFASLPFIMMFTVYVFKKLYESASGRHKKQVAAGIIAFFAFALVLFAMFYPIYTGTMVSRWYVDNFLVWLPSWTFHG